MRHNLVFTFWMIWFVLLFVVGPIVVCNVADSSSSLRTMLYVMGIGEAGAMAVRYAVKRGWIRGMLPSPP